MKSESLTPGRVRQLADSAAELLEALKEKELAQALRDVRGVREETEQCLAGGSSGAAAPATPEVLSALVDDLRCVVEDLEKRAQEEKPQQNEQRKLRRGGGLRKN